MLIPDLPVTSGNPFIRVVRTAMIAMLAVISLASMPCFSQASTKTFTLTVERKHVSVGGGMTFNAWTYSGTVPGPVLKVMQGDEVKINLVNHTKDAHGINVHAAQISPDHFTGDPMKSVSYSFTANVPGVFIYHCTAPPILDHIASGMYGMMIVEPKAGWPNGDAQEVTIVQSELYGLPDAHGFIVGSHGKIVQARPDFVVFNGALNKYSFDHPIDIKVGKLVRLFFVNAGPSFSSAFYVTGVLFDTVYKSGNPANAMHGINTLEVPPSDGAVFEFRVTQPGYYQFMDQNRAQQYKGANGVFRATP
ncbi:MAG: multicopper oxidase domain-containing protein [Candidatus Binataceae bacterium]